MKALWKKKTKKQATKHEPNIWLRASDYGRRTLTDEEVEACIREQIKAHRIVATG